MNGEGVLKGIPDLFLATARGEWHGLYIEIKVLPNQPTDEQMDMMRKLIRQGYACLICYTLEQFMQTVNDYLRLPKEL